MPQGWHPAGKAYRVVITPQDESPDTEYPREQLAGERGHELAAAGGAACPRLRALPAKDLGRPEQLCFSPPACPPAWLPSVRLELVFAHTATYPDEAPLLKARG